MPSPRTSNPTDYVPITEAVGPDGRLPWMTLDQLRWLIRNRKSNGFDKAFTRVGKRRILVHVPTFLQVLDDKRLSEVA